MSQEVTSRAGILVARGEVIAVVMDRSSSMESIREEMQTAFAEFIEGQQQAPRSWMVSLYQFDHRFETVYEGVLLEAVPPLNLEPGGGTALHDAIASAISAVEKPDPKRVIMVIITDGEENASQKYKGAAGAERIAGLIRRKRQQGWEFIFLGAGLDGIAAAAGIQVLPFSSPAALSTAGELALRQRTGATH